jgi:parvulin-like peptidyl-prolyl isomerase
LAAVAFVAACADGSARGAEAPLPHSTVAGVFATDIQGSFVGANGPEGVAAEVDGHPILLRDVTSICLRKYRTPIIDQMIQNYVVGRECEKKGIVVPEAEVDKSVEQLRKNVAPATLDDVIAQHHSTMAEVRAAFRNKIQRGRLVADQVPATAMAHCRAIFIKFAPEGAPMAVAGTARTEANARALIAIIQSELTKGKEFGDMAAKYSEVEPKSAAGDIGVLYPGVRDIDPAVADTALTLAKGKMSDLVRTHNGFWLLQAISTSADHPAGEDAAYKAAHDTYVDQQAQFLTPKFVVDLIEKSHITFATDSECDIASGKPMPEAAATVDGHVIPMKDVAAKCVAENGPRVVDILVQNYLVNQECQRLGVAVPETEVDARLDKLRKLIAPNTIDAGLVARHMTLAELRDSFQQDMKRVRLVQDQVKPTKMAHCRAILIKFQQPGNLTIAGVKPRTKIEALALIKTIQAQLRSGKDFGDLADKYSEMEPKTANGDIGVLYLGMHDMDTGVMEAGLALDKGKTTAEPITTVLGYCLVQSLSTSDDHPKAEDAAYSNTLSIYKEQQSQTLTPQAIVELIKKSKVVYYVHA